MINCTSCITNKPLVITGWSKGGFYAHMNKLCIFSGLFQIYLVDQSEACIFLNTNHQPTNLPTIQQTNLIKLRFAKQPGALKSRTVVLGIGASVGNKTYGKIQLIHFDFRF